MRIWKNDSWLQLKHQYGISSGWTPAFYQAEDKAVQLTSAFEKDTYIGKGTVLQRDISNMPIDTDSDAMAQYMWDWSPFWPRWSVGFSDVDQYEFVRHTANSHVYC